MIEADDTPRRWDTAVLGPMTEDEIRRRFQPPARYRVSRKKLPADDTAFGSTRSGLCFCLAGHATITFGSQVFALAAGDYVRLPAGNYVKETTDEDFDCVMVWELPEEMWRDGQGI